mgnify:CR=1 FL=1
MSIAPKIDDEFKALLPALTPDQREGLEKSILSDGILSPLVVWEEESVLLDGHNRLEITQREGIPFATRAVRLASREAAVEWIFAHQRDRRNLTPDQLALVMGRHYNHLKAAPHSRPGNDNTKRGHQKVDREFRGTDDKLAKEYGVSDMTIQRAGKFAAAVETLKAIDPEIEQKVVTGKGPTRKAVISAAQCVDDPDMVETILKANPNKEETKKPAKKESLADRHGFKSYARKPDAERAEAALLSLETLVEALQEIKPERLNGERSPLTERLGKAAQALARINKEWKGENK